MADINKNIVSSVEELKENLLSSQYEKNMDIRSVAALISDYYKKNKAQEEDIFDCFSIVRNSCSDYWFFLLELFVSNKRSKESLFSKALYKEIISYGKEVLKIDNKQITEVINTFNSSTSRDALKEYISVSFHNVSGISKNELRAKTAVTYMLFMFGIADNRTIDKKSALLLFQGEFFLFFSDNKTIYDYSSKIKSNLESGNLSSRFSEYASLYQYCINEITKLSAEQERNNKLLCEKETELSRWIDSAKRLDTKLADSLEQCAMLTTKCEQLQSDLQAQIDLNEFNENSYQQQFDAHRIALFHKLRSDLILEKEGIEDIIESLQDVQKKKIQRRLDRIMALLDREGVD